MGENDMKRTTTKRLEAAVHQFATDFRDKLTTEVDDPHAEIVAMVGRDFMMRLAARLPELRDAVQVADKQSSITATLALPPSKKGSFKGALSMRVRAPEEPIHYDMHIDEDTGQLKLGLGPAAGPDDGPGDGEEPAD